MDIRLQSIFSCFLAAILCMTAVGCGKGPRPVDVSGVVTLDGKPIAGAGVMFIPAEPGPVGSGTTDANGSFHIIAANQSGLMPGRYRVAISKREVGLGSASILPTKNARSKSLLPEKYANPENSGLEATVAQKQGKFQFDLISIP